MTAGHEQGPALTVRVARLADLPEGAGVEVEAGGRRLALFRNGTQIYALDASCPHAGGPIATGLVRGGVVTCPWHWWRFRLDTGERLGAPGIRLCRYETTVRDGDVFVRVPRPTPARSLRERLIAAGREWEARQARPDLKGAG